MGLNQAFYENGSEVDFFTCLEGCNFVKNEHFLMK